MEVNPHHQVADLPPLEWELRYGLKAIQAAAPCVARGGKAQGEQAESVVSEVGLLLVLRDVGAEHPRLRSSVEGAAIPGRPARAAICHLVAVDEADQGGAVHRGVA